MSNVVISLENVSLAYGLELLLDHAKMQIEKGERVSLIGRNGAGKSSLLKIIDGSIQPDSGLVWRKPNLRFARLAQALPQEKLSVYEYVAQGLQEIGSLLAEYYLLTNKISTTHQQKDLQKLENLQQRIDVLNGWQFEQKIQTVLKRLALDGQQNLATLSGGWQRRAALAKALVGSPELLLLDEPTNHLDIEAIAWLEEELLMLNTALLFVTHDRTLITKLATRIVELDRGQLTSYACDYPTYLSRKSALLQAEEKQEALLDKKLAEEERWIRQGIKARRTRNEGRVRALYRLRESVANRRAREKQANFSLNDAEKSGDLVIAAENLTHCFGDKKIIDHFSCRIMRGDKIGLIGPNGVGKSTLLNLLLGTLTPQKGLVKLGTKLQVAYFDQLRNRLQPEKSVMENVVEGSDFIEVNGKRKHVISYLADFLFSPERARTPVKALSGGEANRLLLARLFSVPSNLLVMDEPTNDLDIETLELLEEKLSQYQGSLLLVSHDRTFLDNVVTSTFVFLGNGVIQEYVGGYEDWLRQREDKKVVVENKKISRASVDKLSSNKQKKLSYNEQQELQNLPTLIEKLESEQAEILSQMNEPAFYQQDQAAIAQANIALKNIQSALEKAYERWQVLETRQQNF